MNMTWREKLVGGHIPLVIKVLYTAFVAVLVPRYWIGYGPTNFLYFCDVALLLTVPALWLENSLLASMALVGIGLAQVLWQVDFLGVLFGFEVLGLTDYMFDAKKDLFLRALSFFHFWLPLLLLYAVWRWATTGEPSPRGRSSGWYWCWSAFSSCRPRHHPPTILISR